MTNTELIQKGKAVSQALTEATKHPPPQKPEPATKPQTPCRTAHVEWASTIRPERQVWLWENRIPVGTVSALAGRGGTGKTTYALDLAARISRGSLPGEYQGKPRSTLLWSGEDAWGPVIVPRAMAANADLTKIGRLAMKSTLTQNEVSPQLPLDVTAIHNAVVASKAALVIIDPIASTMAGDLNREADVREAIDALAKVAADTKTVVMFVRHFGKGGGNPSDKMSGNHAFRDAVRSVFLFAADADQVVVTQDKGNYAPPGAESFAFRLENTAINTVAGTLEVARVVDLGTSEVSVGDIINRTLIRDEDANGIDGWLTSLLANGSVKATEVFSAADAAGYSKDQAKRAKARLGVIAERPTNPGPWFWSLPAKPEAERTAASTEQSADARVLPALPALPVRSEGVEQGAEGGREQSARARSLPSETSESTELEMSLDVPNQLDIRRQNRARRTVHVNGKEFPRCHICGGAVTCEQQGDVHFSCASKPA